ncbi:unnamed protein product [Moneuplotes crassus]|uniref:Uncharacterized protein n=1 Tax=Euplotes crassus TaxID=5936 RepID=A0AAD1Y900_EUPCR|nr:unnamed protein product [Moneuplotes crassus]
MDKQSTPHPKQRILQTSRGSRNHLFFNKRNTDSRASSRLQYFSQNPSRRQARPAIITTSNSTSRMKTIINWNKSESKIKKKLVSKAYSQACKELSDFLWRKKKIKSLRKEYNVTTSDYFPGLDQPIKRIEDRMKKIHFQKRREVALSKLKGMQDFIKARMTFLRIKDKRVKAAKVIQKVWRERIDKIRRMIERRIAKNKAIITVQTHLRSYLFWKKGTLKKLQLEKLEINNRFWKQVKEKQHKNIVRDIEHLILGYLARKKEKERRLSKTRTFWGLTMKIKQILKEYLRFQNKNRNHKKKGHGFRRVRQKESKVNLDINRINSHNSDRSHCQDSHSNQEEKKQIRQSKFAVTKFKADSGSKARDDSISEIRIDHESVSNTSKSKHSSKEEKTESVPIIAESDQKEDISHEPTISDMYKVNEPNLIAEPQQYLDKEKKTLDVISDNIMKEHIAFSKIAQDQEKSRQNRKCTNIKTFNPIQMEKEMITPLPGYLQPTTSRLIKEIPVDDKILDEYKIASNRRTITSKGLKRNDLNQKVDLAEFILSHRSNSNTPKQTKKMLKPCKSARVIPKSDFGADQNTYIFNKEIMTPEAFERADILNDLGLIYEVLTEQKQHRS